MGDKILTRETCAFCKGAGTYGAGDKECSYCHGVGDVPLGYFDLSINLVDLITKLDILDGKVDTIATQVQALYDDLNP